MPPDLPEFGPEEKHAESAGPSLPAVVPSCAPPLPAVVASAGPSAAFAWDEFFSAQLRNPHTRALYRRAVLRFLKWLGPTGIPLPKVQPGTIGTYFDQRGGCVTTRKAELAALRRFFDLLVTRHVVVLNPAASVRGERYQAMEGLTPEITVQQAKDLLASIETNTLAGLRDRALIGVLIYTTARAGAVAKLQLRHLEHDGSQYVLRFGEKGGKQREIPVRHDLQRYLLSYLYAAGLDNAPPAGPLFRTIKGKGMKGKLTARGMTGVDICRMVKRRPPGRGPARALIAAQLPRLHGDGPSDPGRGPGGRAVPRGPRRPAHHPPLRPPAEAGHAQHRRAHLGMTP